MCMVCRYYWCRCVLYNFQIVHFLAYCEYTITTLLTIMLHPFSCALSTNKLREPFLGLKIMHEKIFAHFVQILGCFAASYIAFAFGNVP